MPTVHKLTIDHPRLILITGIMAAGKSTLAQHLAEQLPNSVHLRGTCTAVDDQRAHRDNPSAVHSCR